MSAKERRSNIAAILEEGPLSVDELANRFGVSLSTIRRDFERLTAEGRIVRTYGGAINATHPRERSLREREAIAGAEKAAIGWLAASFVLPGSYNILDSGTTLGALAQELTGRQGITVITNGLTSTRILEHSDGVDLVILGGTLRHVSSGTIGPLAESALTRLTAHAAFLGADGVVAGRGICEETDQQASLKRKMIDSAMEIFVLADATKLGVGTSHWWTSLDRHWHLITDASATDAQLEPFHRLGNVDVLIAKPAHSGSGRTPEVSD